MDVIKGVIEREGGSLDLVSALQEVQDHYGYLPSEVLEALAQAFNRPLSDIYGVATFYSLFSVKPGAKYSIKVCHSLPCYLKEGEVILKAIEKHLNIKAGESTPDHLFSLGLVNCLGLCDISPVILINERAYGNLEKEDIALILESYKGNHDK